MGEILISYDYGRRAEYLTSFVLSPYAITVPIRGQDDRIESDFLCVSFEKVKKSFFPNLKLMFWVQTKSQSSKYHRKVTISSSSKVESILNNKMPYFIAIVNTKVTPTVSLYDTSERIAFKHLEPHIKPEKIHFIPGMPKDQKMYRYDDSNKLVSIYMGKPFLKLKVEQNYERIDEFWDILKNKIQKEYRNYIYSSVGLGYYEREPLDWDEPGSDKKIFYLTSGQLTEETCMSIQIALKMLDLTIIEKQRKSNPDNELVKAMNVILNHFTNSNRTLER